MLAQGGNDPHFTPRCCATSMALPTSYPAEVDRPEAALIRFRRTDSLRTAASSAAKSTPLAHEQDRWQTLVRDRIVVNALLRERTANAKAALAVVWIPITKMRAREEGMPNWWLFTCTF